MKLRRIKTSGDLYKVEVQLNQQWYRLDSVETLHDIARQFEVDGDLGSDVLSVLQLGAPGWAALEQALAGATLAAHDPADAVVLPFAPASFREFTLYQKHFENVARAHVRRYMPGAARIAKWYERLTGKTFSAFRPNPLWFEQPIYYYGSHLNFYADGEQVAWPSYVKDFDYELELAAIVSREVRDVSAAEAQAAIGGYVIINDFSARGPAQRTEMASGCGPQKCKHFANSMGAVVVTADELDGREQNLGGRVLINGELVSECHSGGMKYSFAEIIEFLAAGQTLYPGEILASGTLPMGSGIENDRFLAPGDVLRFELEGLGSLENTIAS